MTKTRTMWGMVRFRHYAGMTKMGCKVDDEEGMSGLAFRPNEEHKVAP